MSVLVQIEGPCGPCGPIRVPRGHAEHRWAASPGMSLGKRWMRQGLCPLLVPPSSFWFFVCPRNRPGFHPFPLSSTGFSTLFPRTIVFSKDAQGRIWAEILLFHASVLLQSPIAPFLCPSASSGCSEQQCCSRLRCSGPASPFRPSSQSLSAICLLQVQDVSVLAVQVGQKALTYTALRAFLVLPWEFLPCIYCAIGERTGLGLLEIFGVSLL